MTGSRLRDVAWTVRPLVSTDGMKGLRNAPTLLTVPVLWTCCTPLMRPIMDGAAIGSSTVPPVTLWPLLTVSRLVPSWLISASRPAWEDADRPSTATIAATPIAIPRADSAARSFRVRSPTVESRARSDAARRLRPGSAVVVTTAPHCAGGYRRRCGRR